MTTAVACGGRRHAPHAAALRVLLVGVTVLVCAGFIALGNWQLARLAWKRDLLSRVDSRIHQPPVAPPAVDDWPRVSAARDEYRRVRIAGVLLHEREALVLAATELGSGFWVMTPLRTPDNWLVWINRGFVPTDRRAPAARAAGQPHGEVLVTGLLRLSEPGGGFLRRNDAVADRWYSRDVQSMAQTRGLTRVAPYFIDADAAAAQAWAGGGAGPVGGLTVTRFNNHHLGYAITWYTLAALLAAATAGAIWLERRR